MAENYVANNPIKVSTRKDEEGEGYVQPGDSVSEDDFTEKDWADLLAAKAVVTEEEYDILHPGVNEGANQGMGTPSNLAQIEGTQLQMNPPENQDDPDTAPAIRDELPNPANVVPVEGAATPGDGSDSVGQDVDEDDLPDPAGSTDNLYPEQGEGAADKVEE